MAYEPTTWECGDVVTAERLNHMEEGIAANATQIEECCGGGGTGGILSLSYTWREATAEECVDGGDAYIFNHTWQDIYDALSLGQIVILTELYADGASQKIISSAFHEENYTIVTNDMQSTWYFNSANSNVAIICGEIIS